jgi:hypothetical protein
MPLFILINRPFLKFGIAHDCGAIAQHMSRIARKSGTPEPWPAKKAGNFHKADLAFVLRSPVKDLQHALWLENEFQWFEL